MIVRDCGIGAQGIFDKIRKTVTIVVEVRDSDVIRDDPVVIRKPGGPSSGAASSGTPVQEVISILILGNFRERRSIAILADRPRGFVVIFYQINANVLYFIEIVNGARASKLDGLTTPRKFSSEPLENTSSFRCRKFRVKCGETSGENNTLTRSHNERGPSRKFVVNSIAKLPSLTSRIIKERDRRITDV